MPKIDAKPKKARKPPTTVPTVKCVGCPNRFVQTRKAAFGGHCSLACWEESTRPKPKRR